MIEAGPTFELLFSEFTLGKLKLKNRLVGLPHGTARVHKGVPDDDDIAYWERRAAGGVAMLTVGGSIAHETAKPPNRWLSEVYNPAAFAQLERRAQAVHRQGAHILTQLVHLGREALGQSDTVENPLLGPSELHSVFTPSIPHPLSKDEIEELIESFIACSVNLRDLGYDGVEVHAAHAYLIAQFLSADANRRDDEYGGDLAGRMRFLEKVIAGVRERCGADFVLGVRLSAEEEYPEGMHPEDAVAIVKRLAEVAPPDYVNITVGMRGAYVKDITQPLGPAVPAAAAVKAAVSLPIMVGSRIVGAEMAEGILRRRAADLVGTARALIADPDWVKKAAAGQHRSIRPCIGVNQECRSFPGGILCAANPRTGRERWYDEQLAAPRKSGLRFTVVGGGPAGLEAARFAAELGVNVVLYERTQELGGQMKLAAAVKSRASVITLIRHLEHEARRLGVEIRLGTEATPELLAADDADAIILATGARAIPPPYDRDEGAQVVSVWDVLAGGRPPGSRALVVDDGSGFWEAVSAAEMLGDEGFTVHLATPAAMVGGAVPFESIRPLFQRLGERKVTFHQHSRVTRVRARQVSLTHLLTGQGAELEIDFVAGHCGAMSNDELLPQVSSGGRIVRTIGDCVSPRKLTTANYEASRTVLELTRAGAEPRHAALAW
jgi:2,4-dienoyl-CoA reductase (NADPH2)